MQANELMKSLGGVDQPTRILLFYMAAIVVAVLIADAVILIRYLRYLWLSADYKQKSFRQWAESIDPNVETALPVEATGLTPPVSPFASTWSMTHPFLVYQVVFVFAQVLATVLLLPPALKYGPEALVGPTGILVQCAVLVLMSAAFVLSVGSLARRYGSSLRVVFGPLPKRSMLVKGAMFGLLLILAAQGAEFAVTSGLPHLLPRSVLDTLNGINSAVTAGGLLEKINSMPLKLLFAAIGTFVVPIGEEVFFRGLLFNSLKRQTNLPTAVIVSGLAFALAHISPIAILVIFPMGMALAYAYHKTGSLWVSILMHATNNGLIFAWALLLPAPTQPAKGAVIPAMTRQAAFRSAYPHKDAVECLSHLSGVAILSLRRFTYD